jgi:hypothetical protein
MVSDPIPSSTKISSPLVSWTTISGIQASAASVTICTCQSQWQLQEQIQAIYEASEGERRAVPQWATYLDAEYDGVDDAVLPATTYMKVGLGQEGQSPHEGEQMHLAGLGVHA